MEDKQVKDGTHRALDLIRGQHGKLSIDYRMIHRFKFVEKITITIKEINAQHQVVKNSTITPKETHENPWVHRFSYDIKIVRGRLDLLVKVGDVTHYSESIPLGQSAALKKSDVVKQHVPRLVLAFNTTPQGHPVFRQTNVNDRIPIVMKWITDRLDRGIENTAWLGLDGGRGLDINELRLTTKAKREELWARRITEVLLAQPYVLPGTTYRIADEKIYQVMADRIANKGDVFYPVTVQCQHSCTMALLSRNIPFNLLAPGCNAGNTEGIKIFKENGAQWHKDIGLQNADQALRASPPAGPGTLFEFFDQAKGANKGGAHIGFILRVHNQGWHGLQTFDTGGLNIPHRHDHVDLMKIGNSALGSGLFDDPWTDRITGSGEPFSGMGVLPAQFEPVDDLDKWIPLAYFRLVLTARSDNTVLYATPLLRGHHRGNSYSIAKYVWSLRALPFSEDIKAVWQVWAPRHRLAEAALAATRKTPVSAILSLLKDRKKSAIPPNKPITDNFNGIICTTDIESMPDGKSRIVNIIKNSKDGSGNRRETLPWGVRQQASKPSVSIDLSSVPEYLKGEEA